jgi:hypothetical protein
MLKCSSQSRRLIQLATMLLALALDALRFFGLYLRLSPRLAAENLFLRKQLALYQERTVRPRRTTDATRIVMVWLGRWFDWRQTLAVVQPKTFIRWHRQAWLFRSMRSACVHAAFSSIPCESAVSSRASQSTKRQ